MDCEGNLLDGRNSSLRSSRRGERSPADSRGHTGQLVEETGTNSVEEAARYSSGISAAKRRRASDGGRTREVKPSWTSPKEERGRRSYGGHVEGGHQKAVALMLPSQLVVCERARGRGTRGGSNITSRLRRRMRV